jgi:hypothetical protein
MAREQNISQDLYDLLISRGWEPESTDAQGQPSQPQEATIFTFDYVSTSGQNYGTAVAVLDDEGDLQLYYGDNLGRGMEEQDKDEWFDFLQQMKQFATRHDFHTFSPRNLNQLKHTMAGMAAIREGLFESYYGNRTVSYSGEPTEARLMIRHRKPLGETDARYRYVESLFVETAEGERWKLPFRMLAGGRAMLEHVRQGGRPYDVRGVHISQMVEEINVLSRFRRATQGRVVEGVAQGLVEQATQYLESARGTLKNLGSSRGYQTYFESWSPADIADTEALVEEVKGLFVETTLDARIEAALPILSRLQGNTMREADIFESWIDRVTEGTWSTPDTPEAKKKLEQLMSQELPVGPDAANAIEQLYDIFGDDDLFDRLQALAERDPDADARFEIHSRAQEMGIDLPEPPIPEPAQQDLTRQPAPGQQDTEQVDEQDMAQQQVNESAFSPEEIAAINQYLDDEISFIELRRGYPGVISKAAQQFGIGPVRGFQGEMDFYDRMVQARDEGDIMEQGVAEGEYDHSELYNGCYVRDEQDGANGEVFRMSGDPEDRRVRIEDKDGRGWYISPHRLQPVDENDPAVARWFGNSRDEDDLSEGDNLATFVGPNEDSTDAMDHRGAVTDSFYEDLARIKSLALSK